MHRQRSGPKVKKSTATFASRLQARRKLAGLSAAQLADRAGVKRQYIHLLERGEQVEHGLSLLCRLADALGCSLDDFRPA